MKKYYKLLAILILSIMIFLLTGCESDFLSSTIELKQSDTELIDVVTPKDYEKFTNETGNVYCYYNKAIYIIDGLNSEVRYTVQNMKSGDICLLKILCFKNNGNWEIKEKIYYRI